MLTGTIETSVVTGDGNDSIGYVDRIIGTDFNDVFYIDADFDRGTLGPPAQHAGWTSVAVLLGPGNDIIAGERQNVGLTYHDAPRAINIDLATGRLADDGYGTTDIFSGINWLSATKYDDTIRGSASQYEFLTGDAGNDLIDGGEGFDSVSYFANPPHGAIIDLDRGIADDDGFGNTDTLLNIEGVFASDHADTITGNDGPNPLTANGGADLVFGRGGPDQISGGAGNDSLDGGAGSDTLDGGDGDDLLAGGTGSNFLIGGPGKDTLTGGTRGNIYDDGNFADYRNASGPVSATLAADARVTGDASVGTDRLLKIDNLVGTAYGDKIVITPSWHGSQYDGGTWFDVIGGAGADTISGNGNTRIGFWSSPTAVRVDFAQGFARDGFGTVDKIAGVNQVQASDHNDTLYGSNAPYESFRGRAGNDFIDGRGGTDRSDYLNSPRGVSVDLESGTAQDGYGTVDTLVRIENARGSRYDDVIKGDKGANVLDGGAGSDRLTGGQGIDRFVFAGADGIPDIDTIVDYAQGHWAGKGTPKLKGKADSIDVPDDLISGIKNQLVEGTWQLILPGDGDIIRLPGVKDFDKDGSILDHILIV